MTPSRVVARLTCLVLLSRSSPCVTEPQFVFTTQTANAQWVSTTALRRSEETPVTHPTPSHLDRAPRHVQQEPPWPHRSPPSRPPPSRLPPSLPPPSGAVAAVSCEAHQPQGEGATGQESCCAAVPRNVSRALQNLVSV